MPRAKPTLLELIASDEPTLFITTACGARLPAHRELLRLHSSCVKGLPPGGDTWDLSGLLIEGAPVSRTVVATWMEVIYKSTSYYDGKRLQTEYKRELVTRWLEAQRERPEGERPPLAVPAGGRGAHAVALLLFADAVCSNAAVTRDCYASVQETLMALQVAVGGRRLALRLTEAYSLYAVADADTDGEPSCKVVWPDGLSRLRCKAVPLPLGQAKREIRRQVAAQLELRLYAAHRLRLRYVDAAVSDFCRRNSRLLPRKLLQSAVYTPRVMAAIDPREIQAAWLYQVREGAIDFAPSSNCSDDDAPKPRAVASGAGADSDDSGVSKYDKASGSESDAESEEEE